MGDLKQKTKVGMVWNAIEKVAIQGISFVIGIVLARLLTPHDYGVVGMLTIFTAFSDVFIDSGFTRALIQKEEKQECDYTTTLIFNVGVSLFLYILLFFAAPAIANFYKTPELLKLERVFFLTLVINSLAIVQSAKFQINVDFKTIAIINSIATIVSGGVAIFAAYKGLGPWALVIQAIIKASVVTISYWILGKWIPKTRFSVQSFKSLFGFGSKLLISGLLSTTQNSITNLVIGKIYNPASLGVYTRAQQFPTLVSGTLTGVLNTATFPLLSSMQKERDELVNILKKLIRFSAMFIIPAMVGLSVLSDSIVLVLLGEKWKEVSVLLFWLALPYIFVPYSVLNMNVLNAIGRSDLFLKIDMIKIPLDIALMIITFPISLKAIVIGKAICSVLYYIINTFLTGKLFHFGPVKQLLVSWKYFLSALVMAAVVLLLKNVISSELLKLCVGVFAGAVSYAVMLFILRDSEYLALLRKIFKKVK